MDPITDKPYSVTVKCFQGPQGRDGHDRIPGRDGRDGASGRQGKKGDYGLQGPTAWPTKYAL